jgi:hypothetical protein
MAEPTFYLHPMGGVIPDYFDSGWFKLILFRQSVRATSQ